MRRTLIYLAVLAALARPAKWRCSQCRSDSHDAQCRSTRAVPP
jgi:hypothetical protein